jgi:hypothetical protein
MEEQCVFTSSRALAPDSKSNLTSFGTYLTRIPKIFKTKRPLTLCVNHVVSVFSTAQSFHVRSYEQLTMVDDEGEMSMSITRLSCAFSWANIL